MIIREYNIDDLKLKYHVFINQIKLNDNRNTLNKLITLMDDLSKEYEGTVFQFFNDSYLLNQEHVFSACYFLQKAFHNGINISNNKSIEFLLYLATNRQIKVSIGAFGIRDDDLNEGLLSYCVISQLDNFNDISAKILQELNAFEAKITINDQTVEKFDRVKGYFKISDNQILSVLNSYGIKDFDMSQITGSLNILFKALHDLICEKMALLSLEKI